MTDYSLLEALTGKPGRDQEEQNLRLQEQKRKLDKEQKMDDVLSRTADRIDSYNSGGNQGDPGLVQVSGPADSQAIQGGAGRESAQDRMGSTPAQEGAGSTPGLERMGPKDNQHRVGFGFYQNPGLFSNPQFLDETAKDFMKNGLPEGVRWLERSYQAQKEGLLTAVQAASAGDLAGAEKAFNATGKEKIQPGSLEWADESKTTLKGISEDGKEFQVKPKEMLKSFLDPKTYFELEDKERKNAIEQKKADAEAVYKNAYADYLTGAKSALARAQADKASGGGTKEMNTVVQKAGLALRKQIEGEQSKEDAKFNTNGMLTLLPDMQSEIGSSIRNGDDPEVAFQQTYNKYKDRVSGINDALSSVAKEANGRWEDSRKDETMQSGLKQLLDNYDITPDEIKKFLPATRIGKVDQDRIRSVLTKMKVNAEPAKPTASAPASSAAPAKKDFSALWQRG